MNDSLPLNTFARNPRRALRRLPQAGLLLTRPGEPDLRLTLEANVTATAAAVSVLAGPVPPTSASAPTEPGDPTVTGAAPEGEEIAAERPPTDMRSPTDMTGLARAALLHLHRDEFGTLLLDHCTWIRSLPHAVRREVLGDAERARKLEGEAGLSATLARWEERTSVFRP